MHYMGSHVINALLSEFDRLTRGQLSICMVYLVQNRSKRMHESFKERKRRTGSHSRTGCCHRSDFEANSSYLDEEELWERSFPSFWAVSRCLVSVEEVQAAPLRHSGLQPLPARHHHQLRPPPALRRTQQILLQILGGPHVVWKASGVLGTKISIPTALSSLISFSVVVILQQTPLQICRHYLTLKIDHANDDATREKCSQKHAVDISQKNSQIDFAMPLFVEVFNGTDQIPIRAKPKNSSDCLGRERKKKSANLMPSNFGPIFRLKIKMNIPCEETGVLRFLDGGEGR
jgi:hypothetical protein